MEVPISPPRLGTLPHPIHTLTSSPPTSSSLPYTSSRNDSGRPECRSLRRSGITSTSHNPFPSRPIWRSRALAFATHGTACWMPTVSSFFHHLAHTSFIERWTLALGHARGGHPDNFQKRMPRKTYLTNFPPTTDNGIIPCINTRV